MLAGFREKGVLRRRSTTPVRPVKLLIAQLLLHLAAAVVVTTLILGIGALVFDAHLPGSPLLFTLAAHLYCVAQLSIGVHRGLVSTAKGPSIVGGILPSRACSSPATGRPVI